MNKSKETAFLSRLEDEVDQLRRAIKELRLRKHLLAEANLDAHIAFHLAIESLTREYESKRIWLEGLKNASNGGTG